MISIREKIYSKAFEDGVNYAIEKMFSKNPAKKIAKNQKKKEKKIQERQANENSPFHDNPNAGLNGNTGSNTGSNTSSNTGSNTGSNTNSKTGSSKQKNIFKKIGNYVKEHPVKTGLGVLGTAGLSFTGYKLAARKKNNEE